MRIEESIRHIKDIHSVSVREGILLWELANQSKGIIVEIGSWKGYSTIWLAKGSLAGWNQIVYAIDPHTGSAVHHEMYGKVDTYSEFIKNIKDLSVDSIVVPVRLTSEEAVKSWGTPVSLLWIDGDHMTADKDLEVWYPYLKEGGIVALHDTTTWVNPHKVAMSIYKSANFKDVSRVGSITYATKTSSLTWAEGLEKDDAYYKRCMYQFILPCRNKVMGIAAKMIRRE